MNYLSACKVRLVMLGFNLDSAYIDTFLQYSIDKAINHIKNFCNISKIPSSLDEHLVDYAVGDCLLTLKNSNLLTAENYDLSGGVVSSITEGDVSVSYATGSDSGSNTTDAQKLDSLINGLMDIDNSCLLKYRRLCW